MYATSNLSFATGIRLITPGTSLGFSARGIRANTTGTVTFRAIDKGPLVTLNVQAGEIIPCEVFEVTAATAQLHGFI